MTRRLALALLLLPVMIALALWPGATAADNAEPRLDPDLPYQAVKSNPVTYEVDFRVIVTPPYHAKTLKVWLPMPQSDSAQEVEEGELNSFPMEVKPKVAKEAVFGNKFAYFEFDHPEGAQSIRHTFKVKVWELNWNINARMVTKVDKWPRSFDAYLRGEKQAVVIDDAVKKALGEIVPNPRGEAYDLALVMNWVNANLKYDHDAASLGASSEHALKTRTGHCSDYHGLCAAFGRALGYPTRVTYGINPFPKNSPSHCKLEAFVPPYGWVSFDVSETQRVIAAIQKEGKLDDKKKEQLVKAANDRLLRGFRDNTWFLQTRGSDYELAPPAARRVPVVRTIYAEADGVALPEPDPANKDKREFAWMTVHGYKPDKTVPYPFKDWKTLEPR